MRFDHMGTYRLKQAIILLGFELRLETMPEAPFALFCLCLFTRPINLFSTWAEI
jgi:hypothetical protein